MTSLTHSTKPIRENAIKREWRLLNLKDKVLGRAVTEIATYLQGKNKVNYVNYLDGGDYVVVINAAKVVTTGKKAEVKEYTRYSGYPSGLKKTNFKDFIVKHPEELVRHAVSGMLPKNKHRDQRLARLFIYKEENHPYGGKFK